MKTERDRLMAMVDVLPNGCWPKRRDIDPRSGYAYLIFRGRRILAHRAFHIAFRREIPKGVQLDHICHDPKDCSGGRTCPHRRCCNPDHTVHSTPEGNSASSRKARTDHIARPAALAVMAAMTHCRKGHEFTPDNTIPRKGKRRDCGECIKARRARARAKRDKGKLAATGDE